MDRDLSKKNLSFAVMAVLSLILCIPVYRTVTASIPEVLSDYNGHAVQYLPHFLSGDFIGGWKLVPYFMWEMVAFILIKVLNIPHIEACAFTSCIFTIFSFFVICYLIAKYRTAKEGEVNMYECAFLSFGLLSVQGLYFNFIDTYDDFLGIYSMNPLHSPSQMCVMPFSIICFMLVSDIFGAINDSLYKGIFFKVENGLKKYYVLLSIWLFLSVLAKPTFAEMFIPAVGIIALIRPVSLSIKKDSSVKKAWSDLGKLFLCAVPSLMYIFLQFLDYFVFAGSYGDSGHVTITGVFEVWSMYSENIFLSILLQMAFPIAVVLINPKEFFKDFSGKLAGLSYAVALIEGALLGESGENLSHSDFLWPMMSALVLMFTVSVVKLCFLSRNAEKKSERILTSIGWFLFAAHILCGILYINRNILFIF